MKGKKKKKRYFCDKFHCIENGISEKTIIVISVVILSVLGILTYILYQPKVAEREVEISKYSEDLYDELKESIINNISEETGIDDIALRKEVYSYNISSTKGQTTLTCTKVSNDGFYATITVTLSSRYTILAEGRNYESKEDYAKEYDKMHNDYLSSLLLSAGIIAFICAVILVVIGMAYSKSANNKEKYTMANNRN